MMDIMDEVTERWLQSLGSPKLRPSEREELRRVLEGKAAKDSANELDISPETIRARRKGIYRKVGIHEAGELIAAVLKFVLNLSHCHRCDEFPCTCKKDEVTT